MASHFICSFFVLFLVSLVLEENAAQRDTKVEFVHKLFSVSPNRNLVADRLFRMARAAPMDHRRLKRSPEDNAVAVADSASNSPALKWNWGRKLRSTTTPRPPRDENSCHIFCSSFPQHWRRFRGNPAMRIQMMDYDNEVSIVEQQVIPFDPAYEDDNGGKGDAPMTDVAGGGDE